MSALTQQKPGIWRWDGVDADHGFPIVGFVTNLTGKLLLIDPPGTSGSREEIERIGKPEGIILTGKWHVRGAPRWAKEFGIPLAAHESALDELKELGGSLDVALKDGDEYMGWRVVYLSAQTPEHRYDELAFWDPKSRSVVIGDLVCEDDQGRLGFGPNVFGGVPVDLLRPLAEKLAALKPRLVLSSHLGVREDAEHVLGGFLK